MTANTAASDGLFRLNPNARAGMKTLGGRVPVLFVDDVFADPERIRGFALGLDYHAPDYPYPGRLAEIGEDASLNLFLRTILSMVNVEYLPRIPPIADGQQTIKAFSRVLADFAVTDIHPNELSDLQRKPHVDPVPIFGLVYLNPVERGGTLFFNRRGEGGAGGEGYFLGSDEEYELVAKIEGSFNRLAVYPGFVPHTGEISGDWIMTDERFSEPRLTQRLVFFP